jgi:hypothetical protein
MTSYIDPKASKCIIEHPVESKNIRGNSVRWNSKIEVNRRENRFIDPGAMAAKPTVADTSLGFLQFSESSHKLQGQEIIA